VEYSDDEMERIAKKKKRNRRNMRARATEADAMYKEDETTGENFNRGTKRHMHPNGQQQIAGNNYGGAHPQFTPPMVPGFIPYGPLNPYGFRMATPPFPSAGNNMQHFGGNNHRFRGNRQFRGRPNVAHQHHPQYYGANGHPPPPPPPSHPSASHQFRPWCPPNPWRNNNHSAMSFDFRSQNPFPNVHRQPAPPPPPPPRYTSARAPTHSNYEPPPPGTNITK